MLKRLSGLSKSAIKKTRQLLGVEDAGSPGSSVHDAQSLPVERDDEEAGGNVRGGQADGGQGQGKQTGERERNRSRGNRRGRADDAGKPIRNKPRGSGKSVVTGTPRVVPRSEHPVSRKTISRSALKVLDRLHQSGFGAFLVGGGVRDALVGMLPKDFDIATDASPEDVRALFGNSRIIGRRFRLVHVVFGREIIEVATFRAAHDKGEGGETGASGRIVRDNVFGTIEEDALRRDFSVNALYYNIADRSVVDYAGGLQDIEAEVFRLIGDPLTRCEEDPVRVLRAARLSAKLGFSIEEATLQAMRQVAPELAKTAPARLFDEVLKLFQGGYAERSFAAVVEHDLLRYLFPLLQQRLERGEGLAQGGDGSGAALRSLLDAALANTDKRVDQGKPITPSYLLAFMLWPDVEERACTACAAGSSVHDALREGAESVLAEQLRVISIPRRFSGPMKEIWQMQPRLERLHGARALRLMESRRFRAAYDFLCLRATVDERLAESASWWTEVQTLDETMRLESAVERPLALGLWQDGSDDAEDEPPGGDAEQDERREGATRRRRRGGRRRGGGGNEKPGTEGERQAPSNASATPAGDSGQGAPKKKRRRRRRKPGGDKSRQPGPSSSS